MSDKITQLVEQQPAKCSQQSQEPLNSLSSPLITEKKMSVYSGDLNLRTIFEQNKRIITAFPQLSSGFYEIFVERLTERKFTDQRLIDAVSHVIDTCPYPIPTVANFLSYDRCIDLLNHSDLMDMLKDDIHVFDRYEPVRIPGLDKARYARKEDILEYKLEKWNN